MTSTARLLDMLDAACRQMTRDVVVRDRLIVSLYKRGISLRQLAEHSGLSHETVRTIIGGQATPKVRVD